MTLRRAASLPLALLYLLPFPGSLSADEEAPPELKLEWRSIGPYRGGRVTTVAGVIQQRETFYMGATGGGVWKTEDAGVTWTNVSDGHFGTGSVGAVAVAPSDPNVVYVGMGEAQVRGVATSHGDGVYRSRDGGGSWEHLGLEETRQISAVRVHPSDPETVYVAAQGYTGRDSAERGIYRSRDGGDTWEQVHFVSERAGASSLSIDPTNPRVLYAGYWEHRRHPWKVESGGPGSGIFKSSDGGDTWRELTTGLPELMGKVGVDVSPADPRRVWAIVEAEEGGLFRSDDGGESWKRVNSERVLRARAWYYTRVFADPIDADTVYVLNAPVMKSVDGGRTFERIRVPHGDNHALWIHPHDNTLMINGNDGGANVSTNGGRTWSTQTNQPTAQFYRVNTDRQFPYRVYGGQQDNSSVSIASRTFHESGIGRDDWYPAGGCETAYSAFDPDDPRYVYSGCYQGLIGELDVETGHERSVMAHEFLGLGTDPGEQPYRFNWNAPIVASPHDPTTIYHAANKVLVTRDRGVTWEEISPDLTRNDPDLHGPGGGPITNEAAGGENYNTILYLAESSQEAGTIWVGSDDGRVHLTRNGGADWSDVTPPGLPESMINAIDVSPHDPGGAWLAVTRYKFGDYEPRIYRTDDYGASWVRLDEGIEDDAWVRVVRQDPERRDLVYAGTETGFYVSFDRGESWRHLQGNLPVVPITDLDVVGNDLVAATQGRAFWILDDLAPLREWRESLRDSPLHLFPIETALRVGGGEGGDGVGKNPPRGAAIHYWLGTDLAEEEELRLDVLDSAERVVRSYSSRPAESGEGADEDDSTSKPLPSKAGLQRFVWNLRGEPLPKIDKLLAFGGLDSYRLGPGSYTVRLTRGETSATAELTVVHDPRTPLEATDFEPQQALLAEIEGAARELLDSVRRVRSVREQVETLLERIEPYDADGTLKEAADTYLEALDQWEDRAVQKRQETFQDVINFHNRLNARLASLMGTVDESGPPVTAGARRAWSELSAQAEELSVEVAELLGPRLESWLALLEEREVPLLIVPR